MHGSIQPDAKPNALERDTIFARYTTEDGTEDSLGPWMADASVYGTTFRPVRQTDIILDVEAGNGFAVAAITTDAERMALADVGLWLQSRPSNRQSPHSGPTDFSAPMWDYTN